MVPTGIYLPVMTHQRYDIRKEDDGTWTVFDVFTGWPVDLKGEGPATGMNMEDADYLMDLLNALYKRGLGED